MALYDAGRKKGNFDAGIEQGLRLILASPEVPVPHRGRGQPGQQDRTCGSRGQVSDIELASRLSFFLWSSIPDEELLTLATKGSLSQPAVLERQVKRMLADPKSRALVDNFASQWLMLRNLKGHIPTPGDFPNFDNELRQAFRQRDGDVRREHHARGPQRHRSAQRRLHVRERAAGAALRHPERLRQPLPAK